MARNKTLLSLLQDFRAETRQSGNAAHNTSVRDTQVRLLQRVQEWLWEETDWPHLRVRREIALQAGQRYYSFPEDLPIDRCEMIDVRYGGEWCRLSPGIGNEHYSTWDSDLDERSWPVERWQVYEDEMFELWPIPASNADPADKEGTLRLTGTRALRSLVQDGDQADLDDRLIVLYAAAEHLAATGANDAGLKLEAARRRKQHLISSFSKKQSFSLFGAGRESGGRKLRGMPRVHYRKGA